MPRVDLPSFFMVLFFTTNILVSFFDSTEIYILKEIGMAVLFLGSAFFVYVLLCLRSGFLGETDPKLDYPITKDPYRLCRHPQYLSFIMIFGFEIGKNIVNVLNMTHANPSFGSIQKTAKKMLYVTTLTCQEAKEYELT